MASRLEFSAKVKQEIWRRAGGPGNLRCEGCGLPLNGKPFEYDHTVECWEMRQEGRSRPLTAEDGKLLGRCCHRPKTARKAGERAHGKRIVKKSAKAMRRKGRPMPGSRTSAWKAKLGGGWERR